MLKATSVLLSALVLSLVPMTVYAGQWYKEDGKWAYTDDSGNQIKEGWFTDTDGKVYNFNGGVVRSGFYRENDVWYYFDPVSGERRSGWVTDGDKKYFFNFAGVMQNGWLLVEDKYYYADGSGAVYANRRETIGGNRYFFKDDGSMAVNEWVDEDEYYAGSDGILLTRAWVDGIYLGTTGKVTDNTKIEEKELDNKIFTVAEYMSFANDATERYYERCENLFYDILDWREEYNEENVWNYESEDDDAVNDYIERNELKELDWDSTLNKAAALRAAELASQQRASGARPDGRAPETVLEDYGTSCVRYFESVAYGQEEADDCFEDLKDEGNHTSYWRDTTIDRIGIGMSYDVDGKAYWVVIYAQ